ncbi:MAG: gamma carbonic anhydrase family protein [bacterium]
MQIQNPKNLPLPPSLYGGGLVLPYLEHAPVIGEDVFLAPHAAVIGQVTLGGRVSIWFGAVLRGDIAPVTVGEGTNIQDNSVLHVGGGAPCVAGRHVVVGHHAVLHGCTVEDGCVIGMGAIVLDRAVIGQGSVIGAGSLITQGTVIPPYSLVLGSPGQVARELTEEEIKQNAQYAPKYIKVAVNYGVTLGE